MAMTTIVIATLMQLWQGFANTDTAGEESQQQDESLKDEATIPNTRDAESEAITVTAKQQPTMQANKLDSQETPSTEESRAQNVFGQDNEDSDNLFGETESSVSNNEANTPSIPTNPVDSENNKPAIKEDSTIQDSNGDVKNMEDVKIQKRKNQRITLLLKVSKKKVSQMRTQRKWMKWKKMMRMKINR